MKKHHEELTLVKKYNPIDFPRYENFDGIEIGCEMKNGKWQGKLSLIPYDYEGIMGVPVTFLDKYNPDQFEIVGYGQGDDFIDIGGVGASAKFVDDYYAQGNTGQISVGWKHLVFYHDGKACVPYGRVLIKRKV